MESRDPPICIEFWVPGLARGRARDDKGGKPPMRIIDPLIPEIARDLSADAGITKPVPGKRHGQSYPRGLAAW